MYIGILIITLLLIIVCVKDHFYAFSIMIIGLLVLLIETLIYNYITCSQVDLMKNRMSEYTNRHTKYGGGPTYKRYSKIGAGDDFPYKSTFLEDTPEQLFRNLKSDLLFDVIKQEDDSIYIDGNRAYSLMDVITDLFSERVRMRTAIYGKPSPYDFWNRNKPSIKSKAKELYGDVTNYSLRETLYSMCKEATLFKTSLVRYIMDTYLDKPGHVMDPFAGWGDRLIGCLASNKVLSYTGTDTNKYMRTPYDRIMEKFDNTHKATVYIMDFMEFSPEVAQTKYDIIFTSPPFFDFEGYAELKLTSPTYESWLTQWMLPAMIKMIDLLSDDGKLMLYVGGTYRTTDFDDEIVKLLVGHYKNKYHISKLLVYSTANRNKRPIYIVYLNKALSGGYISHDNPQHKSTDKSTDELKLPTSTDKSQHNSTDHPIPIIITDINQSHFDDIKEITSNESVMKWVASGRTWNDQKVQKFINYNLDEQKQDPADRQNFSFGVTVQDTNKLVAIISIHKPWHQPPDDDPLKDAYFITRFVHKDYQRKKITTRATKEVIAMVRSMLNEDIPIYADVRQDNTAMNGYHIHVGNSLIGETSIGGKKYNRYLLKE